MSSLFKSKSKETPAAPVPISYERLQPSNIRVGGATKLTSDRSGGVSIGTNQILNRTANRDRNIIAGQRSRLTRDVNQLRSGTNAYVQARVRPLEERLDNTLADQSRQFSRRGVFGSLSENELNKTRFLGEREIGDARVQATNEALGQILNTEAAISGLSRDDMAIAETQVRDELARVGLSADVLIGLLGQRRQTTQATNAASTTETPSTASIVGGILSAF